MQLPRDIPEARLVEALDLVMASPAGQVPPGALAGQRPEASDVARGHGSGAVVRGTAQALLLVCTGRAAALDALDGDGAALLRERLAT